MAAAKRVPAKKAAPVRKAAPAKKAAPRKRTSRSKPAAPVLPPVGSGTVVDAVTADLRKIAVADPELARSALALSAVALAKELDNAENSATSKSMCAGRLLDTMDRLRELTPKAAEQDGLDDLKKARDARLAGRPTAKG